jgi:type III restriction enzyme
MVDSDRDVECWVRLHIGELPILWSSGGREVVIENDGTHYVVEVKMNKEMSSADMLGKREAARRWANHVTADSRTATRRTYLCPSPTWTRRRVPGPP